MGVHRTRPKQKLTRAVGAGLSAMLDALETSAPSSLGWLDVRRGGIGGGFGAMGGLVGPDDDDAC